MTLRRTFLALSAAGLVSLTFGTARAQAPARPTVVEISLDGAVDPLAARYVQRGLRRAADINAAGVLIRIDTPGGLGSSMRTIVSAILASRVPVVCWVGPAGARAASAGALILLSCPKAVMAPATEVGAAHPVGFTGEILSEKVTNDAAAYARALAQRWGRNADLAERMVRESVSVSAEEALQQDVIDRIEEDERAVVVAALQLPFGSDPRFVRERMTLIEWLLHNAVDPNLAFLFLVLGLAGIVFEVAHPGVSVPGILGTFAFVTSLVILGMLPVNLLGVLLVLAGVGLFVVEAYMPGFGVPAALGFGSLLIGGLFLFDASVPRAQVSKSLVVGTSLGIGLLFGFVVRAVVRARRMPRPSATPEELVGVDGVVVRALDPTGIVRARNEQWTARAAGAEPLPEGAQVRVARVDGLTLVVERTDETMEHKGGKP